MRIDKQTVGCMHQWEERPGQTVHTVDQSAWR